MFIRKSTHEKARKQWQEKYSRLQARYMRKVRELNKLKDEGRGDKRS